ncbi:tRNA lysidine(34) synthetase TilS [Pseudoalteromonas umbrosa]|uniref:tRNA lysidine(34) synthetase TilS n=1 Tax=Pseudoalteromonas umbrosa TaxID=3048489 RepID=UPI0024C2135C|nr:tRNA lysidine(34) synthetase TilS [Pseudoalteromonas sp. B95]MDK1285704.1 tRNA lysidine(34) synthetase TilS [Pseudoalteromonas sp. B95]
MESTGVFKQFASALEKQCGDRIGQGLTVALSGGVDSVVLLHLCQQFSQLHSGIQLEAIYVNHGLSDNADMWQQFCTELCAQLNISFQAVGVSIEAKTRTSLEAQARDARYAALDRHAMASSTLVLGQHADDQVETFFIRLKRGSGLQGLGAMRASTQLNSGRYCVRPLIDLERKDIEAFAQTFGLSHIEDESNKSDEFDRNFLRNQVIPLLTSRFKGFIPSVLRSISLLQAQQSLIDEIAMSDLAVCRRDKNISVVDLAALSELRQSNVVRLWLGNKGVNMPSQKQLGQILNQTLNAKEDAQVNVQLQAGSIKCYNGLMYWVVNSEVTLAEILCTELTSDVELADGRILTLFVGKGVRRPLADEQVTIRFGQLNEKIKPIGKPGRNTVKHWLKEAKVPSWERPSIPMIYYNDALVAVVGFFVNADYKASSGVFWQVQDAE